MFRRVALEVPRPDIAAAFPGAPGAEESGFRASVGVAGAEPGLEVRAVLEDKARVPVGTIRARRRWRELIDEIRTNAREREWTQALRRTRVLLRHYPQGYALIARRLLPARVRRRLRALWQRTPSAQGPFGDLRRVTPISPEWGLNRGRPIDRYYIENFLLRQAEDIQGRVLEIGDDGYTRNIGGSRVTVSDVLHVTEDNPQATIVADLTRAEHVPSDTFDCIILTQTLHLIYDVRSAIQTLHRVLKPGGVLLATFPGISQISQEVQ